MSGKRPRVSKHGRAVGFDLPLDAAALKSKAKELMVQRTKNNVHAKHKQIEAMFKAHDVTQAAQPVGFWKEPSLRMLLSTELPMHYDAPYTVSPVTINEVPYMMAHGVVALNDSEALVARVLVRDPISIYGQHPTGAMPFTNVSYSLGLPEQQPLIHILRCKMRAGKQQAKLCEEGRALGELYDAGIVTTPHAPSLGILTVTVNMLGKALDDNVPDMRKGKDNLCAARQQHYDPKEDKDQRCQGHGGIENLMLALFMWRGAGLFSFTDLEKARHLLQPPSDPTQETTT